MKRISIAKYLNSINNFYCNKAGITYQPISEKKEIIDLNNNIIIEILEKQYEKYPYMKIE